MRQSVMKMIAVALVVAGAAAVVAGQDSASRRRDRSGARSRSPGFDPPTSQPATVFQTSSPLISSHPFDPAYGILLTRSIFARSGRGAGVPAISSSDPTAAAAAAARNAPEASLTFRGVMRDGPKLIAFIEDARTGKTLRIKAGDPLATGRVTELTLDRLVYQVGDKRNAIEVGYTLSGGAPPATQPTGGASGSGTSSQASSASPSTGGDDIVERLRRRREQEGAK